MKQPSWNYVYHVVGGTGRLRGHAWVSESQRNQIENGFKRSWSTAWHITPQRLFAGEVRGGSQPRWIALYERQVNPLEYHSHLGPYQFTGWFWIAPNIMPEFIRALSMDPSSAWGAWDFQLGNWNSFTWHA